MRTILYGLSILTVNSLASSVTGCTADCEAKGSCGEYVAPPAGASAGGNAGESEANAGESGTDAGEGGTSGTSDTGSAGLAGESGRSGSEDDNAGASGAAGDGGTAGGGAACDTTLSPREESCLIGNDYAVFVAPNGKNNAPGTRTAPLATLSEAIALAAGTKFVIVCDAIYDEHVTVSAAAKVYGGFRCPGDDDPWVVDTGAPLFRPSSAGPALEIDAVAEEVWLESLKFEAPAATLPGGTSIAALLNASPKVKLNQVTLTAGAGMAGANGTLSPFAYRDQAALNGNPETATGAGGEEKSCACQSGLLSIGGAGGPPASAGQNGSDGLPNWGGGQAGDHAKACSAGGGGGDGSAAPPTNTANGAATLGVLSADGWQPRSGTDGVTGSPGQGGGGGASRNNLARGGGGGCGGCGGNGGTAGKGGGGSIALLLIDSPVVLNTCSLKTSDAGDGGAGIAGQFAQQQVGNGGNSVASTNSCGGGSGGKGADGGASGGGAGGVSVGVLWKGKIAPSLTGTTMITGRAGVKGMGGVPGTNDGIPGVKQDVLYQP
ncbi:MAG: hypothetical protein WDO74_02000 [Pseudomonadota bacterium]